MTQKGFTLLEVLIVMLILAMLALGTSQAINRYTTGKVQLQRGIDQQAAVRNALSVMERDISLAFHYRDPNIEAINQIRKAKKAQLAANPNPDPSAIPDPESLEPINLPDVTMFQGLADRLSFTALANVQTNPDQGVSSQMEVSYYTETCNNVADTSKSSTCLFRRTYHVLDGNLDEGGNPVIILENIKSLRFRYFGEGKDDWVETWRTAEGADDLTRNRFPLAVEITIEHEFEERKVVMTTVAQLRFPNNPPIKEDPTAGALGPSGGNP